MTDQEFENIITPIWYSLQVEEVLNILAEKGVKLNGRVVGATFDLLSKQAYKSSGKHI